MQRVLVIVTRQIGDVLLTTPLVSVAQQVWPQARIDVLGIAGTLGMLKGNTRVHATIECPARMGWRDIRALVARLWRRYDLALIADPGDRAHLIGWAAAPLRCGIVPGHGGSRTVKRLLLSHAVTSAGDRGEMHVVQEKLALLAPWRQAGHWTTEATVALPVTQPLPADLGGQIGAQGRRTVVVHAPSMWQYKQWPIEHYRQLVQGLLDRGLQVVLTGSASERDQACIAPLRALGAAPQLIDSSGGLDFSELTGLLQRAALFIGPDTSVTHLAAATGTPVIALFGPTNPRRWGPLPPDPEAAGGYRRSMPLQRVGSVTLLQGTPACVPCGRAGCEDHRESRSDCLLDIDAGRVLAAADAALGR